MSMNRLHNIIIPLCILILVLGVPAVAHAQISLTGLAAGFVYDLVEGMLNLILKLADKVFIWIQSVLDFVVRQQMSYGGPAVYFVWKTFRDMCNMFFIVVLILISFATIFNSWLSSHSFYYKEALFMVIIAAITMNLSMAAGQMIVLTGNQASLLVLELMEGVPIGNKILTASNAQNLKDTSIPLAIPQKFLPQEKTIYDALAPEQQKMVASWLTAQQQNPGASINTPAMNALRACLKENSAKPADCNAIATTAWLTEMTEKAKTDPELADYLSAIGIGALKSAGTAVAATNPIGLAAMTGLEAGKWLLSKVSGEDPAVRLERLADIALRAMFMVVMTLSLLVVVGFMFIRIPFIWLLLAISSIAFFSLAWPGRDTKSGLFQKWYGTLIGWSFFGPLYLFVIYIGLFIMGQTTSLVYSLGDERVAAHTGILSVILMYTITAGIFMGGAKAAYDFAFSFGAQFNNFGGWMSGKFAAGEIMKRLGADDKSNFGLSTVGAGAARLTGARTAYDMGRATGQAAWERGKQAVRPLTERITPMGYDERLARAKARFGVTGADQEVAKITAAKVGAEKTRLEQQMLGKDRAERIAFLKGRMNSVNKNEALAAREHLLAMGQLSPDQIKETRDMLPSEAARIAWDQKARKGGREERKKEYADILDTLSESEIAPGIKYSAAPFTDRQAAAQNALNAIPNPAAQKEFLTSLAERDPEIAATISTASTPALGTRAYDNIVKNPDRVFDLPDAYKWSPATGGPPPPEFQQLSDAFNRLYPMPPGGTAAPGSAAERALDRRERMKEQLLKAGGVTNADFVEALMRS